MRRLSHAAVPRTCRSAGATSWAFSSVGAKASHGRRSDRRCTSARGQVVALGARQRLPLFACPPAGIIAFGHVNSFLICGAYSIRPRDSGGGWRERSQSRDAPAPEFCKPKPRSFYLQKIRGGGAPKRRNCPVRPHHASDVATRMRFGRGRASSGTRSPFGAPPRLSPRLSPLTCGSRPGFLGRGPRGRYPRFPVPAQWQHPTHRSYCRRT